MFNKILKQILKIFKFLPILTLIIIFSLTAYAAKNPRSSNPANETGNSETDIAKIQCIIMTALNEINDEPVPACLTEPKENIDLNCDGKINMVDIQIATHMSLNKPLPIEIDANGNNIPDCKENLKPVCTEKLSKIFTVPDQFHTLYDILGTSNNNIFVAAGGPEDPANGKWTPKPLIFHYDGKNWTKTVLPTKNLGSVTMLWGTGPNDIFAIGGGTKGLIFHYDGEKWIEMENNSYKAFVTMWGAYGNDVYAFAGANETSYYHYNGNFWSETAILLKNTIFNPTDPLANKPHFSDIWGTGNENIMAINNQGDFYKYNGEHWETFPKILPGALKLWGLNDSNIYVISEAYDTINQAGYSLINKYDGTNWSIDLKTPIHQHLYDIHSGGPESLFAVGGEYNPGTKQLTPLIFKYKNNAWEEKIINETFPPNKFQPVMEDLWVNHEGTDLFMLGAMTSVYHYQNCP